MVLIAWLGAVSAGTLALSRTSWFTVGFFVFLAGMIAILLALCWIKGEKPRWRWGDQGSSEE